MMPLKSMVAGALVATTALITVAAPAVSAPLIHGVTAPATANVQQVRYRHWHGGGGWRHHGGWHHHRGWGGGAALGGLAAGAIIGGAIAAGAANAQANASYCAQRYRSYDPGSGTYLGYDGLRHPCP